MKLKILSIKAYIFKLLKKSRNKILVQPTLIVIASLELDNYMLPLRATTSISKFP